MCDWVFYSLGSRAFRALGYFTSISWVPASVCILGFPLALYLSFWFTTQKDCLENKESYFFESLIDVVLLAP